MDEHTFDLLVEMIRQYRRTGNDTAAAALQHNTAAAASGDRDAIDLVGLELKSREVDLVRKRARRRLAERQRVAYWQRKRKREAEAAHARFSWHCEQHTRRLNAESRRDERRRSDDPDQASLAKEWSAQHLGSEWK